MRKRRKKQWKEEAVNDFQTSNSCGKKKKKQTEKVQEVNSVEPRSVCGGEKPWKGSLTVKSELPSAKETVVLCCEKKEEEEEEKIDIRRVRLVERFHVVKSLNCFFGYVPAVVYRIASGGCVVDV